MHQIRLCSFLQCLQRRSLPTQIISLSRRNVLSTFSNLSISHESNITTRGGNVQDAEMVISSITNLYFSDIYEYHVELLFRVYSDVFSCLLLVLEGNHFVYVLRLLVNQHFVLCIITSYFAPLVPAPIQTLLSRLVHYGSHRLLIRDGKI